MLPPQTTSKVVTVDVKEKLIAPPPRAATSAWVMPKFVNLTIGLVLSQMTLVMRLPFTYTFLKVLRYI